MRCVVLLVALLAGCSGSVGSTEPEGCSVEFMRCLAGGDSGAVYSWESDGTTDTCTCEASLQGEPVKLVCSVLHRP